MNDEHIYWLFSSAAQSIATFVAFLLAGYTLVHAMMESIQQRDDTLEEIHAALIRQYYRQIRALAVLTGVAVVGSLAMLYLNGFAWPLKQVAVGLVALVDIAAIGWGIAFVIGIIDPDKYRTAARRLIAEDGEATSSAGPQDAAEDFFALFDRLQAAMETLVDQSGGRERVGRRGGQDASFRQLLFALSQRQLIDRSLFNTLMHIARYRNLAYYGRLRSVDPSIAQQTRAALARLEALAAQRRTPA